MIGPLWQVAPPTAHPSDFVTKATDRAKMPRRPSGALKRTGWSTLYRQHEENYG
jgi:hypothetical protein